MTPKTLRDERGSTLLLTLVFMALFGTLVAALLAFGDVSLNLHDNTQIGRAHV